MIRNTTRKDLKKGCLGFLGHPVVKINLTDEQIDGCVNAAIKKLWRWDTKATVENFYIVELTQDMIDNGIILPVTFESVTDIIPTQLNTSDPMYFATSEYVLTQSVFLNGVYAGAFSLVDYYSAQMRVDNYRKVTGVDLRQFTFNKFERKLVPRFAVYVGMKLCIRCLEEVDPESTPAHLLQAGLFFDNETLKELTIAYMKQNIGHVLGKYEGMTLPGGQVVTGATMLSDGKEEEANILQRLRDEACDLFYLE